MVAKASVRRFTIRIHHSWVSLYHSEGPSHNHVIYIMDSVPFTSGIKSTLFIFPMKLFKVHAHLTPSLPPYHSFFWFPERINLLLVPSEILTSAEYYLAFHSRNLYKSTQNCFLRKHFTSTPITILFNGQRDFLSLFSLLRQSSSV